MLREIRNLFDVNIYLQMTPKEAFRKLSHRFHGKGPGKMKQEKRMKQYQEELKLKQMNTGDTPLTSMEKMHDTHAKLHTPYIFLSGQIKPGYAYILCSSSMYTFNLIIISLIYDYNN